MGCNYIRTESKKFSQSSRERVYKQEEQLRNLSKRAHLEGISCSSSKSATNLVDKLNQECFDPTGQYVTVNNVVYFQKIVPYENHHGFNIQKGGVQTGVFSKEDTLAQEILEYQGNRDKDTLALGHLKATTRFIQTDFGLIDVGLIDSYKKVDDSDSLYFNKALESRMSHKTPFPNYNDFKKINIFGEDNAHVEKTVVNEYKRYSENHAKMTESLSSLKLIIDDLSFNRKTAEESKRRAVDIANLFESPEVSHAFKQAKKIGVHPDFLKSISFVRPSVDIYAQEDVGNKMKDAYMAYDEISGKLLVNLDEVSPDFFNSGGFYHEIFHAKIFEENVNEVNRLMHSFQDDLFKNAIFEGLSETAAHLRASNFLGEEVYNNFLYQKKFSGGFFSKVSTDRYIFNECISPFLEKNIDQGEFLNSLAEVMCVSFFMENNSFNYVLESFERHKSYIGEDIYNKFMKSSLKLSQLDFKKGYECIKDIFSRGDFFD